MRTPHLIPAVTAAFALSFLAAAPAASLEVPEPVGQSTVDASATISYSFMGRPSWKMP